MTRIVDDFGKSPTEPNAVEDSTGLILIGKKASMGGDAYRYRDTYEDAVISPSPDPTNPYANTRWKFGSANTAWSNLRGCRKEWYNHSWNYRHMSGLLVDKANFIHSGTPMGVNTILDTMDPVTGTFWVPECYCYNVVRPDGGEYVGKGLFLHGAAGPRGQTAYKKWIAKGERFGAAWDVDEKAFRVSYRTANGRARVGQGWEWNFKGEKPSNMAIWHPIYFKNLAGTINQYNCERQHFIDGCLIKGCNGDCYTAVVIPYMAYGNLCNMELIKYSICYDDDGAIVRVVGGDSGTMWDVYWGDDVIGKVGDASANLGSQMQIKVGATGFTKDIFEMGFKEHFEPCYDDADLTLHVDSGSEVSRTGKQNCGNDLCTSDLRQTFQINSECPADPSFTNQVIVLNVESYDCVCGHWQCWWNCGAGFVSFSEDGVNWVNAGGFPDFGLKPGSNKICFIPLYGPNFPIRYVRVSLTTSPWNTGCVCAEVKGVQIKWKEVTN